MLLVAGSLVAKHLASCRHLGVRLAVGGRSEVKLERFERKVLHRCCVLYAAVSSAYLAFRIKDAMVKVDSDNKDVGIVIGDSLNYARY